jgi:uncharacterized protein (DUF302 family)
VTALIQEAFVNERDITTLGTAHIQVTVSAPFEKVLQAVYDDLGDKPLPLNEITAASASWDAYQAAIETHLGPSGFVLFSTIDHGAWVKKAGIERRAMRIIFGNPMVAITLLRHDLTAGLFVPVELIVVEEPDGSTSVTYLRPSTLLRKPSGALLDAAHALDAKLDAFIDKVLGAVR